MFLSYVIVVKNEEKFLTDCLDSVVGSSSASQVILIDDESSDDTYLIASEYASKFPNFRCLKGGGGKVICTNIGARQANGRWIRFIDGDDIVLKDRMPSFNHYLKSVDAKLVLNPLLLIDAEGMHSDMKVVPTPDFQSASMERFVQKQISVPKACLCIRSDILEKVFPIPEFLPYEDAWMSLASRIYASSESIELYAEPTYGYRQHDNQTFGRLSDVSRQRIKWRAGRQIEYLKGLQRVASLGGVKFTENVLKAPMFYNKYLETDSVWLAMKFLFALPPRLIPKAIIVKNFNKSFLFLLKRLAFLRELRWR